MKFIDEVKNWGGKTVLLRTDLNVKSLEDSLKLDKSLGSMRFLLDGGARMVVMSHRGRPDLGKVSLESVSEELSLGFVVDFLSRNLDEAVEFLPDFDFESHRRQIAKSSSKVFLLENVRMHEKENSEDETYGKEMATLGEVYVNDAFASWHKGTSVTVLPKLLPSFGGLLLRQEIKHLSGVMSEANRPLVVVLAGGKAEDKFSVLKNFYDKTDKFLIAGVLANTILKAANHDIGPSIIDETILEKVVEYVGDEKIQLPVDFVYDGKGKIMDMGEKSGDLFAGEIAKAKSVIWNGPAGMFEQDEFRHGSEAIARAIAANDGFSVVGGGETTNLVLQMGLLNAFSWLSTGGGAMIAFLAGKRLPSLEALGYYGASEEGSNN